MSFCRIVRSVLTVLLFSFSFVTCATHGYKHHHDDKVIARATTSPLTLAVSGAAQASSLSLIQGTATPCSGSACITAVPTWLNICPAGNGTAWTEFATAQNYTIICDVDFPAQNIYPFVLARSFQECMAQCESYNAKNPEGDIHCEGFVFAPDRVGSSDDCYLKSSLDRPSSATIRLNGATRVRSLSSTARPLSKPPRTSMYLLLITSSPLTLFNQTLLPPNQLLRHLRAHFPLQELRVLSFMALRSISQPLNGSITNPQLR